MSDTKLPETTGEKLDWLTSHFGGVSIQPHAAVFASYDDVLFVNKEGKSFHPIGTGQSSDDKINNLFKEVSESPGYTEIDHIVIWGRDQSPTRKTVDPVTLEVKPYTAPAPAAV